jgi:hypothetical protein
LQETAGGKAAYVMVAGGLLLVLALVLLMLPAWRRLVKAAQERGGWRALVLGTIHVLLMLAVGAAVVEALRGSLLYQSNQFERTHGRVSETNYNAMRTNMGPPHEQDELAVAHYVTEEKEVYYFRDGRQVPVEEVQTLDADADLNLTGERPAERPSVKPGPASDADKAADRPLRRKIKVRRQLAENSVVRGTVDVDIRLNYRMRGSAYYTCYDDTWKLDYTVKNRSDKTTEAEFQFPMPADQGSYNHFTILVDGKNWSENLVYRDNAQTWKMPMLPGQEVRVQVAYASRGMEHVRYIPGAMETREAYQVVMRVYPHVAKDGEDAHGDQTFRWADKQLSLPIGTMRPTTIRDSAGPGEPMVLEWDLTSAATSLDMGVLLPRIPQPGYYGARLLREAPGGLILLVAALVVSWILLGREADLFSFTLLAVAYYLFYTLVANLSDLAPSFTACFALAAGATLLISALYLWLGWGRNFAAHQTVALMAAMTLYYPLAVVLDDYTGLMTQVLYWALALYAAMLAVAMVRRARRAAAAPA